MNRQNDDLSWAGLGAFAAGSLTGALAGLWALSRLMVAMANAAPGFWYFSRASSIVGYVLLWVATAWGIMLSSKGVGGLVSSQLAFALHTLTSWLALAFGAMHGLALLGDKVVTFTLGAIAVPFMSAYQPFLTGLGTLALYVSLLISVAFYLKKRLGRRVWRSLHGISYLAFAAVTVHSFLLGTDASSRWMQAIYLMAGGSVVFLTAFRLLTVTRAKGARAMGAEAPQAV